MTEVEQSALEQFLTFRTRLCEILSEVEEEIKSAFIHGYAKGETDAKFRTKQENAALKSKYDTCLRENTGLKIHNAYVEKKLNKAKEILKVVLNKWKEDRWILQSEKEVKMIEKTMKEAEQFLKED